MNRILTFAAAAAVTAATAASAHDYGNIHHRPRLDFGQKIEALLRLDSLESVRLLQPARRFLDPVAVRDRCGGEPGQAAHRRSGAARARAERCRQSRAQHRPDVPVPGQASHAHHRLQRAGQRPGRRAAYQYQDRCRRKTSSASGLTSCDPARVTPWGTVIVGEENGTNGRIFEILDPLHTTNVTVPASGFGASSDPAHVAARPALGQFSFEGLGILPNGVVYLTDENRPGGGGIGNPGGAIVKFIPQGPVGERCTGHHQTWRNRRGPTAAFMASAPAATAATRMWARAMNTAAACGWRSPARRLSTCAPPRAR